MKLTRSGAGPPAEPAAWTKSASALVIASAYEDVVARAPRWLFAFIGLIFLIPVGSPIGRGGWMVLAGCVGFRNVHSWQHGSRANHTTVRRGQSGGAGARSRPLDTGGDRPGPAWILRSTVERVVEVKAILTEPPPLRTRPPHVVENEAERCRRPCWCAFHPGCHRASRWGNASDRPLARLRDRGGLKSSLPQPLRLFDGQER